VGVDSALGVDSTFGVDSAFSIRKQDMSLRFKIVIIKSNIVWNITTNIIVKSMVPGTINV